MDQEVQEGLDSFWKPSWQFQWRETKKNDEHDEIAEWVHWWEANDRNSNMAAGHGKATIERLDLVEIVFQKPGDGVRLLSNIEESWLLSRQLLVNY